MTNYTQKELIAALAERIGFSKAAAGEAIGALTDIIKAETDAGKKVAIPGLGRFEMKERAARLGRNPATGAAIQIAASRVLGFKASKTTA